MSEYDLLRHPLKIHPDAMFGTIIAAKLAATALWTALDGIERGRV